MIHKCIKGVKETRLTWRYQCSCCFTCFLICFPETPHSSWTNHNVAVNVVVTDAFIQRHVKGQVLVFFGYVSSHVELLTVTDGAIGCQIYWRSKFSVPPTCTVFFSGLSF